jgi:hypothetical protein
MIIAAPRQGGHHRVNKQSEDNWIDQFSLDGFGLGVDTRRCGRLVTEAGRFLSSPQYPAHFNVRGLVFFRRPA